MEPLDETAAVISAAKVTGTAVFNTEGEQLGDIHDVMLDKRSGKIAYAVLSFGGFLGMGSSYHPLPWRVLDYDVGMGGYVVDIDRQRLEGAPRYTMSNQPDWRDRAYTRRIDDYWMAGV